MDFPKDMASTAEAEMEPPQPKVTMPMTSIVGGGMKLDFQAVGCFGLLESLAQAQAWCSRVFAGVYLPRRGEGTSNRLLHQTDRVGVSLTAFPPHILLANCGGWEATCRTAFPMFAGVRLPG